MAKDKDPRTAKNEKRIRLTLSMRHALHKEQIRTGLTVETFSREQQEDLGLIRGAKIKSWLDGQVDTVNPSEYQHVLAVWQRVPDQGAFVKRTRDVMRKLRAERDRTQVGIRKLLDGQTDLPEGLTSRVAWDFFVGTQSSIRQHHLDYLLRCWSVLPNWHASEVDPELVDAAKDLIRRSNKAPGTILRGAKDKPKGLSATTIHKLLRAGTVARQDHLDYIIKLYEAPDDRIGVPQRVRDEIRRHVRRTGVGPDELLRRAGVIAADEPGDWSKWPRTSEREDDLAAMLSLWRSLPDRVGPRTAMSTPAPASRKKGHHKRLQSEELEEHRRYRRFVERVRSILPLPEKHTATLFAHLRRNGGQLSQEIRETEFAGLTNEEIAAITRAYMVTLLEP